ncbi:fungal-specific transcription factor domain-domain-containing protein [Tuber borchii]|uniref:Fungal-specific transcription factor domain-domain-containing protein n=1 Tax=Tuber borchii TaxID=42251 RepID=A0A2T6ZJ53_TUBBO|nr:fungal-specific transcription factor domain-domain-containing protein [Tuber borchii]
MGKYYLDYFDKRVCRDFILFERYGDNPYRNLLSLAAEHPSFLHAALAVSARHYSNNTGFSETDALVYKGRAINSLSQDLQKPNYDGTTIVREPVLAAMLLFLFFEALESGKDTWKIHLQGARRLIQMSGGMDGQRSNLSSSLGVLITHVAAIDIIGKSLAFSGGADTDTLSWGGTNSNPEEIFKFLEQAEHYSFLGCPAELLQLISLVSQHKKAPPTTTATFPTTQTLLSRITNFNPQDWVSKRLPSLNQNAAGTSIPRLDARELYHHVCAYKCAVHILALQVLTPSSPSAVPKTDELVDEIIAHITSFEPGSVFFKGVFWPVFLAGAAATNERQREFVRETLKNIWELLPQFNVKSAGVLLEAMWKDGEGSWKERLARTGSDYLFI